MSKQERVERWWSEAGEELLCGRTCSTRWLLSEDQAHRLLQGDCHLLELDVITNGGKRPAHERDEL